MHFYKDRISTDTSYHYRDQNKEIIDSIRTMILNLTYNNPDPTELGECTGNYQKIKDLILAARNQ